MYNVWVYLHVCNIIQCIIYYTYTMYMFTRYTTHKYLGTHVHVLYCAVYVHVYIITCMYRLK